MYLMFETALVLRTDCSKRKPNQWVLADAVPPPLRSGCLAQQILALICLM